MKCVGCGTITNEDSARCCSLYSIHYDLVCAGISEENFKSFSSKNLKTWICIECRSKQPRGDNTRQMGQKFDIALDSPEASTNVTLRAGQRAKQTLEKRKFRTIVTEELKQALTTDSNEVFRKIKDLCRNIFENINKLGERITAMEIRLNQCNYQSTYEPLAVDLAPIAINPRRTKKRRGGQSTKTKSTQSINDMPSATTIAQCWCSVCRGTIGINVT